MAILLSFNAVEKRLSVVVQVVVFPFTPWFAFFILHSSFFIPPATRSFPAPSPHILRIFYGYSTLPLRVLSVETRKKPRENTENIRRKVGEGMKKMRQKLLNNVMSKTAKPFKYTTLTTVLYLRNMNNTPILS